MASFWVSKVLSWDSLLFQANGIPFLFPKGMAMSTQECRDLFPVIGASQTTEQKASQTSHSP